MFIGDALEESPNTLTKLAGQLAIVRTPVFVFQEGYDPNVARVYQQIAHLSGGAYCSFDERSAEELKELLSAVAVFASGGYKALEAYTANSSAGVKRLTQQLKS